MQITIYKEKTTIRCHFNWVAYRQKSILWTILKYFESNIGVIKINQDIEKDFEHFLSF